MSVQFSSVQFQFSSVQFSSVQFSSVQFIYHLNSLVYVVLAIQTNSYTTNIIMLQKINTMIQKN